MGTTSVYSNWLANVRECGLTNEQACGLAMLQAWTLTQRKSHDEVPDAQQFWFFVENGEFGRISKTSFSIDDFIRFIPEFKLAGELLQVSLPDNRKSSDNEPTNLLDLEWPSEISSEPPIDGSLIARHRFDLAWCQRVGECLREEIRTPRHAYVFADYVTKGFAHYDPDGFVRILDALLRKRSPIVYTLSSGVSINKLNGLEGYEPFQIALWGFMGGNPELGEVLWNLQRVLFYEQPSGNPTNLDKQHLPTSLFLDFAEPLLNNFLQVHRASYLSSSRLVASEYVLAKSSTDHANIQLHELMDKRYGLSPSLNSDSKPLNLIANAAAFYTLCCLRIRNLMNRIDQMPSLHMTGDVGLLWGRDSGASTPLIEEAVQCFDVMLSWRIGSTWGLFLETETGFTQRVYVGDTSETSDVEDLFATICTAYQPVSCVVAFLTDIELANDDDGEDLPHVAFLCVASDGDAYLDFYRSGFNVDRGQFLGAYLGRMNDKRATRSVFAAVQNSLSSPPDDSSVKAAQDQLAGLFDDRVMWQFDR